MDKMLLYKTAMLAGEIMAQSGAETFRVEDTMIRILRTSHFQTIEVHATTTGIMATLADPTIEPITGVKRISNRSNNLSRINEVNQISRNICENSIDLNTAYDKLSAVRNVTTYSGLTVDLATIISTIGFVGLFGGNIIDCMIAALNGLFIVIISRLLAKRLGSAFMVDAAKSLVIAIITMLSVSYFSQAHSEIIIIGSIMPLVPGIPITNAIRDTLQGDYTSGMARATEAFVVSLGIAVGVGFGMGLYNFIERMVNV
ncbi:MAG: hypothetical protein K0S76_1624 [Herbinix sp.]|jgi:uncharacterized membrane protein YjjP (DUF1212 family)|nr:hypothetical protein [Herbinix sp.]